MYIYVSAGLFPSRWPFHCVFRLFLMIILSRSSFSLSMLTRKVFIKPSKAILPRVHFPVSLFFTVSLLQDTLHFDEGWHQSESLLYLNITKYTSIGYIIHKHSTGNKSKLYYDEDTTTNNNLYSACHKNTTLNYEQWLYVELL